MPAQFAIDRKQAEGFAKVWSRNGIIIPVSDVTLDFATDFANVVLRGFIALCETQQKAAQDKQAQQQPQIITER